ncbi:histone H3.v1-like [Macrobrachium nipponense]|uniref:histone H3.v1-like n=1 Tax=Macrobrachium nipponense TaxID=159736 RepID=UPI0030C80FEA
MVPMLAAVGAVVAAICPRPVRLVVKLGRDWNCTHGTVNHVGCMMEGKGSALGDDEAVQENHTANACRAAAAAAAQGAAAITMGTAGAPAGKDPREVSGAANLPREDEEKKQQQQKALKRPLRGGNPSIKTTTAAAAAKEGERGGGGRGGDTEGGGAAAAASTAAAIAAPAPFRADPLSLSLPIPPLPRPLSPQHVARTSPRPTHYPSPLTHTSTKTFAHSTIQKYPPFQSVSCQCPRTFSHGWRRPKGNSDPIQKWAKLKKEEEEEEVEAEEEVEVEVEAEAEAETEAEEEEEEEETKKSNKTATPQFRRRQQELKFMVI